jgi:hypothetical protein
LETASELRAAGLTDASQLLESAATYVTGSGWEWLGELGIATATIRKRFKLPKPLAARIKRIRKAAVSRRPYG